MRRVLPTVFAAGVFVTAAGGQPEPRVPVRTFELKQLRDAAAVQFGADGKSVFVLTPKAIVTAPLTAGGTSKSIPYTKGTAGYFVIRSDGKLIMAGSAAGLALFDPDNTKKALATQPFGGSTALVPSADGKHVALAVYQPDSLGLHLAIYDATELFDAKVRYPMPVNINTPVSHKHILFSPDATAIAVYDRSRQIQVFDMKSKKQSLLAKLASEPAGTAAPDVGSVAFSSDSRRLYVPAPDGSAIGVWDIATQKRVAALPPPGAARPGVRYSYLAAHPDGKSLAAVAAEGKTEWVVRLDVESGKTVGEFVPKTATGLRELTYSPDGKWLAVTAENGKKIEIYKEK